MIHGISNNPYLFAGQQRDSETGLDYLRARYYDPTLGRFVSADAYEGTLDDPMSLHDYQYAHANPVVNTDPSGYFSIGELLGTLAGYSVLAGLSYTTGSAVGTVAGGGSAWDAVAKYDQFFAGLTDALTFGISSHLRTSIYGETATSNHKGIFFNLGRLGGAIASMWIGANGTTFAEFSTASWLPRAALGYDLFGAGLGMAQSTINVAKGQATWWDILPFLPALTWFNIKYKVNIKGLGSNFGNLEISRRLSDAVGDLREQTGVRRYFSILSQKWRGGTVGVAVTDIPGLENKVFGGASGRARIKNTLAPLEGGDIKPPTSNQISQGHAEQDMANQLDKAIQSSNLTEDDLVGRTVFRHLEAMPCDTCRWGLLKTSTGNPGVLSTFSSRYPQLRMIVTAEGIEESLKIQGGKIVEDFQ
ncbi:MAG: RHS repeat-associated core domain-containing protein [Microcoleus sp.]